MQQPESATEAWCQRKIRSIPNSLFGPVARQSHIAAKRGSAAALADAANYTLVDNSFQTVGAIVGNPLNGESGTLSRPPTECYGQ